jgi:hypothetical protein
MSKEYDFYKCMKDFQKKCIDLPKDVNQPVIDLLNKIGCSEVISDIVNVQKHGLFGQYKIINKRKTNIMYTFKYQCGMVINWEVTTTIERENTLTEVTNSYKNKYLKIEKRKKGSDEQSTNSSDD